MDHIFGIVTVNELKELHMLIANYIMYLFEKVILYKLILPTSFRLAQKLLPKWLHLPSGLLFVLTLT